MGRKHRVTQLYVPRATRSLGSSDSVNKGYGMLGCIRSQSYQTRDSRVLGWRGSSLSLSEAPFTSMGSECLLGALFPTHKETLAGCLGHLGLQKSMPWKDTTSWESEPQGEDGRLTCVTLIHRVDAKCPTSLIGRALTIWLHPGVLQGLSKGRKSPT